MNAHKPLLLWDVDDTLNRQIEIFLEHSPLGAGKEYREIVQKPQYLAFGVPKEEYLAELDRCRREFVYDSLPRPEIMEFFREYGHSFRSMALSAVPITLAPLSAAWVLRHFGQWMQGTIYVPSERKGVAIYSQSFGSKAEAAAALNGILIDDTPEHVENCRRAVGRAYTFPAPWNGCADMAIEKFLQQLIDELELKK